MNSVKKRTINLSRLDYVANFLSRYNIKVDITLLHKEKGSGVNDIIPLKNEYRFYFLRRLEYKGYVILEKLVKYSDANVDDVIFSHEFEDNEVPAIWNPVEIR